MKMIVPFGKLTFQTDKAKTVKCPIYDRTLFTTYEGDGEIRLVECLGPFADHVIEIAEANDGK